MLYFDIDFAIKQHDAIIEKIGGLKGYNQTQIGYLISTLEQIQNDNYYPNFTDKLTHLIFSCIKFHPFLDGNKRSAIFLGYYFAIFNDIKLSDDYFFLMEDIVIKIAENSLSKEQLHSLLNSIINTPKN